MKIIGVKYGGKNTDFEKMMNQKEYENALFIFNDNYLEHKTTKRGAGNAKMRVYNNYSSFFKSFGIPTGNYRKGYNSLDECVDILNEIFEELDLIIKNYDTLVYSIDEIDNLLLGTSIFKVHNDVLKYITNKILSYGTEFKVLSVDGVFEVSEKVRAMV